MLNFWPDYFNFEGGNNDQIFIGWRPKVAVTGGTEYFAPRNLKGFIAHTNLGVKRFWEKMGIGKTVYQALESTTSNLPPDTILALWGYNPFMELGNPNGDDNLFVWG